MAWIEVVANGALKQRCILRDYCQTSSKVQKSDGRCVESINTTRKWLEFTRNNSVRYIPDVARYRLDNPEECKC